MKNTRLIFVAGMSGAGKSTTAQRITNQLKRNAVDCIWLHEEIANHPIRDGEFSYGELRDENDMDTNCDLMVKRWEALAQAIVASNRVYVMEGCLYQSIIRYFIDAHYPQGKITTYYDRVMAAIAPTNPILVFLRPLDVRRALENVYPIRGDWWRELIMKFDPEGYFKTHPFHGEGSIYEMHEHCQRLAEIQFDRYDGWKLRLDTTSGNWVDHLRAIMELIELPYIEEKGGWTPDPLDQYTGTYAATIDGRVRSVQVFSESNRLYCKGFWPYMGLQPREKNLFEMASFPIEFHFREQDGKRVIKVTGTYDWSIVGQTLVKVDA